MLRERLHARVGEAVAQGVAAGTIPSAVAEATYEIADTKSPEHGDYACNLAMTAAKRAGVNPRALGETLAALLREDAGLFAGVEVAGPGFLNLRLRPEAVAAYLPEVRAQGPAFARSSSTTPQRINVEYVSVNPNGPITIGSGRGAAFGSTLVEVLRAAGHEVWAEYYVNDGVNSEQMRLFAESVRSQVILKGNEELQKKLESLKAEPYHIAVWDRYKQFFEFVGPGHSTRDIAWFEERYQEFKQSQPFQPEDERVALYFRLGDTVESLRYFYILENLGYKGDYVRLAAERLLERLKPENNDYWLRVAEARRQDSDTKEQVAFWTKFHEVWSRLRKDSMAPRDIVAFADVNDLQFALVGQMQQIQRDALNDFGVRFDTWFSEQSLHDTGVVAARIEELIAKGVADEEPYRTKLKLGKGGKVEETIREDQPNDEDDAAGSGATLWLRSTRFGDDMDRVLRRRDGRLTYIASDVAYHQDKFGRPRDADRLITILGPDHHGYIGRLTAVVAALLQTEGESDEAAVARARARLQVVIYQLVRFLKDGHPAPMRKRDGNIYELRDLVREIGERADPEGTEVERTRVGVDVARWYYLSRSHDTALDFDLDLAVRQTDDNPVFYAQYAHARISSLVDKVDAPAEFDPALLVHPRETALLKKILDLPSEVRRCAEDSGVHRLTVYATELARTYHGFYDACRVNQPDQPALTAARVALCLAVRDALRATFDLLGISAPERM